MSSIRSGFWIAGAIAVAAALLPMAGVEAAISVTGQRGASLESLAGSQSLVTVILKDSLARDVNLRVTAVEDLLVHFSDERGNSIVYPQSTIREVRVQRDRVENPFAKLTSSLQSRDQVAARVRDKAAERAAEMFQESTANPANQLGAAYVGAAMGDTAAREFIEERMLSSDPDIAARAADYAATLGITVPASVLQDAMRTGSRHTRGVAARLAGRFGYEDLKDDVFRLVRDPDSATMANAAYGAGYFGDERAVPYLLRALNSADVPKAKAAVDGLAMIGGEQVEREIDTRIDTATGFVWFRSVIVLFKSDDALGRELMRTECFTDPLFKTEAAFLLMERDYWDANIYLRRFIEDMSDSSPEAFIDRVRAAVLLHARGYVQARATIRDIFTMSPDAIYIRGSLGNQKLLREALTKIQVEACSIIAREGDEGLLPLMETVMDSQVAGVVIAASQAVIGVTDPEIREQLEVDF